MKIMDNRGSWVSAITLPLGTADLWLWHDRFYLLRAVPVDEYRRHMRVRSPRWGTVMLPTAAFRELVRPFREFVAEKWSTVSYQFSADPPQENLHSGKLTAES